MKETKSLGRLYVSQNLDPVDEKTKCLASIGSVPGTPQRVNLNTGLKTTLASSTTTPNSIAPKRISSKAYSTANVSAFNKSVVIPEIVPRTNVRLDKAVESRKEVGVSGRIIIFSLQSRTSDFKKSPNRRDELKRSSVSVPSENARSKAIDLSTVANRNIFPTVKCLTPRISAVERNVKDDICTGSGRQEMNSMMKPPVMHQMCLIATRRLVLVAEVICLAVPPVRLQS